MKIEGDTIHIEAHELMTDGIKRELCKHAMFDRVFVEGVGNLLIHDSVEYHDDDSYRPWWIGITGRERFWERCRKQFIKWAPRVVARLVDDLTKQRDQLFEETEQLKSTNFALEERIRHLRNELRKAECALGESQ